MQESSARRAAVHNPGSPHPRSEDLFEARCLESRRLPRCSSEDNAALRGRLDERLWQLAARVF